MNVRSALEFCMSETAPSPFSCAGCMAAAAPESSQLRAAYEVFIQLPAAHKIRCLRNVLAGARVVARSIKSARVDRSGAASAWGVVDGGEGRDCFAFRSNGVWYARSGNGLARMHVSRVKIAWELK